MKKKLLIIGGLLVIVIVIVLLIMLKKSTYVIKVSLVDERSPDRRLTVYKDKEKIEVSKITYLDGTLLCEGYNTTVHFGDVENEKELKIILKDKTEVVAKVIEEEVK